MQYMVLIYWDQENDGEMTPEQWETQFESYRAYTHQVRNQNLMVHGEALEPPTMATTVRVQDGKTLTIDGPFAGTKEQLGGYYLLDCANLDEAIEWAAKIPHAQNGAIEIRPVMKY